jgi:lysophospholipase L1-like esterase
MLTSACGDSPSDPSTQLQISCPAAQTAESVAGDPVIVNYASPMASGGTAPVTTTCTPATGSPFPVGTTTVNCTAHDAHQHAATCSLAVTVTKVGTLSATRFMAFGDSITFGAPSIACNPAPAGLSLREYFRRDSELLFRMTSTRAAPSTSYPTVLQALLASRYLTQQTVVLNEGVGGEAITGVDYPGTIARMRDRVRADAPQIVLLLEGINDINEKFFHDPSRIPQVPEALHDLIKEARQNGAQQVFLGTLLPEDPNGCRGSRGYDLVAPANDQIRAMAIAEGVPLVDVYQAFGGVPGPYIGVQDGLHPTDLGYQKMAETFLDTIKKNLETH